MRYKTPRSLCARVKKVIACIDDRKKVEDRLQLLLDVTNQVVLQLRDLLRAISVRHAMRSGGRFLAGLRGHGCKPSGSIFRRAKGLLERIPARWKARWAVSSSVRASPGQALPRTCFSSA